MRAVGLSRFSVVLRELRLEAKLTQQELELRAATGSNYVSQMENGPVRVPTERMVERLCGALGCGARASRELRKLADDLRVERKR